MLAHGYHHTRDQIAALLEERDTLREEVRQLKAALAPAAVLPRHWRLKPKEEILLRALRSVGPNVLHRERAMLALYDTWQDAPDQKIVGVFLVHLRRKLMMAQAQIPIETVWGRGWRLSPQACACFDAAVRTDRMAWEPAAVGGDLS